MTYYLFRHLPSHACKIVLRVTGTDLKTNRHAFVRGDFLVRTCECGDDAFGQRLEHRFISTAECTANCMGAYLPECHCACNGNNHGSFYDMEVSAH